MKSISTDLVPTLWAAPTTASTPCVPIPTMPIPTVHGVVLADRYAPFDGTGLPFAFADGATPLLPTNAPSGTPTWSPPV